ncbi:hypothetical protein [Polycladidibacter hongkongensis]|uniref:hypothetical protein n=1 Tax=Polycladidibacter hongkongensis TaxID=1647556 RepID=UPI000830178E|nr:hypothetical protein [Pseudovibrio hongkongensis]
MLDLTRDSQAVWVEDNLSSAAPSRVQQSAEAAVPRLEVVLLEKGARARLSPRNAALSAPVLAANERQNRFLQLIALWGAGCHSAIDEQLFYDCVSRHPETFARIRQKLRRELFNKR